MSGLNRVILVGRLTKDPDDGIFSCNHHFSINGNWFRY